MDLYGRPDDAPAMSDLERKRMRRRASEVPRGHAMPPGTGPAGEVCGTCAHDEPQNYHGKRFHKCGANVVAWTHSRHTDIRVSDAACSKWEPRT